MPWPQTGVTQYHAQLGLPDKGRAIKGLVVCNIWDKEPLDLLDGLALGCYQPSPEVLIVLPINLNLQETTITNIIWKVKQKIIPKSKRISDVKIPY